MDQIQGVPFGQDAFGQPIRLRQGPNGGPHIELQIAGTLPEGQQAAHRGQAPVDATGALALVLQQLPPALQIRQGEGRQRRRARPGQAGSHVAGVGPLRMD